MGRNKTTIKKLHQGGSRNVFQIISRNVKTATKEFRRRFGKRWIIRNIRMSRSWADATPIRKMYWLDVISRK